MQTLLARLSLASDIQDNMLDMVRFIIYVHKVERYSGITGGISESL